MPEASSTAKAESSKPSTTAASTTASATATAAASAAATAAAAGTTDDATRGRPYYEKLRHDLKATIEEKRKLDKQMAATDAQLARLEAAYLDETAHAGNIIRGFDQYTKATASLAGGSGTTGGGGTGTSTRRKGGVSDADRIFSRSSVAWGTRDSPAPVLGVGLSPGTPGGGVGTPGSARGAVVVGKKVGKKAAKREEEGEERPGKRGKVSWGRE